MVNWTEPKLKPAAAACLMPVLIGLSSCAGKGGVEVVRGGDGGSRRSARGRHRCSAAFCPCPPLPPLPTLLLLGPVNETVGRNPIHLHSGIKVSL
jgi:hypothetical protein